MTNLATKTKSCDSHPAEKIAHQQARSAKGEPMRGILEQHLVDTLELPNAATAWLLGMWDAIQFLDDVADGDDISRDRFDSALNQLLVAMPSNPFFIANSSVLLPVVAVQLLKWQASDIAERGGKSNAVSFVWRAGYYDLVLLVVQICHGYNIAVDMAPTVMGLYGETLDEYKKEFANA
jgi:hypothetical protein